MVLLIAPNDSNLKYASYWLCGYKIIKKFGIIEFYGEWQKVITHYALLKSKFDNLQKINHKVNNLQH